jgi:UDP-glucose 4-epimerase
MKVLVAGGAGFIGSTIASACIDAGITPVVVDNLSTGRSEFVAGREFFEGDIADHKVIERVFDDHPDIHAAILCAAHIEVLASSQIPIDYYRNNVSKSLRFVDLLLRYGCNRLIFSSSASLYKSNATKPVDESSPIEPLSPYARTKAVSEWMFEDISNSGPLRVVSFRYFNPIGADPQFRTGLQLSHPTHALGKMIEATHTGARFEIYGSDYPTRDGTGIRDYVHVWDVAQAHVLALTAFDDLINSDAPYEIINLGTGTGTTVRELLQEFNRASPVKISAIDMPRRDGDIAGGFADFRKAQHVLGWIPRSSLSDGIRDSLKWMNVKGRIIKE